MRVSNSDIDRIYVNIATRNNSYKFNMPDNHFHMYYELYYCKASKCTFFIENQMLEMNSGDFLLIPPREMHYTKYTSDTPCVRINIYFKYSDLVDNIYINNDTFKNYFSSKEVFHVPAAYQGKINEHLQSMLTEDKLDDEHSSKTLRLLLKELFLYCIRLCSFNRYTPAIINTTDEHMLTLAKYITDNYDKPLTLNDISDMAGLSYTYFSKKFKNTTGMRFKEYLNYVRLKQAATKLATTKLTVTDIAISCGFNDSNYFKDAFKKTYGLSPRHYRKSSEAQINE